MINNFKYSEGDAVKCINVTSKNHEGLVLHDIYCVVGANYFDDNVVYAVEDKDGNIHHAIDRFELVQKGNKCISMQEIDMVNHPSHYADGKIECIDALEVITEDLKGIEAICTANAVKYLWRWKKKNGKQDLEKSIWYINKLIKSLEAK